MANTVKRVARIVQKRTGARYTLARQCVLDVRDLSDFGDRLVEKKAGGRSHDEAFADIVLEEWGFTD